MPTINYATANGMILGEDTGNSAHVDYIPDALGSVVAAVNQSGATTYTAAYKPYGSVLASTGTAPNFAYVGMQGYLGIAGVPNAETSVRDRFYSTSSGQWTSVDRLWPNQQPYSYCMCSPLGLTDPSGQSGVATECCWTALKPVLANQYKVGPQTPSKCMKNKKGTGVTGYVGDGFDVQLDLMPSSTYADLTSPPGVVWWECSNAALTETTAAGTWVDRTRDLRASLCTNTWKSLRFTCGGDTTGTIGDEPGMPFSQIKMLGAGYKQKIAVRNLFIYVAFVPGSSCGDSTVPIKPLKIFQQIVWDPVAQNAYSVLQEGWPNYNPVACQTPPNGWP